MYFINKPVKAEYKELVHIWEDSVKATHYFLKEEDILYYKNLIEVKFLELVDLYCIRNNENKILGFSGISGKHLEMLFMHSDARGLGLGKKLLEHAVQTLGIKKVDVNEQNIQAIGFYECFGFTVFSRSEHDATGKPYPILHMQLVEKR